MEYADYNDNEIVYLVKKGSDDAFLFLVNKYKKMILSRIDKYKLADIEEDALQEGIICLYNAAITYNEKINKTFNKYFEKILFNKLYDLKRKKLLDYEFVLSEKIIMNTCAINESIERLARQNKVEEILSVTNTLNEKERIVFNDFYIEELSIDEIAEKEKIDKKYIYYLIFEIRTKIKKNMLK